MSLPFSRFLTGRRKLDGFVGILLRVVNPQRDCNDAGPSTSLGAAERLRSLTQGNGIDFDWQARNGANVFPPKVNVDPAKLKIFRNCFAVEGRGLDYCN